MDSTSLIGAIVTLLAYALTILVFVARLAGSPRAEHGLGLTLVALLGPLLYLLLSSWAAGRTTLYRVQVGLMIVFLLSELLLDYVFKVEFRSVRWMTIAYVTLFFAATGGMLGVASHAGKGWTYASIALFLAMAVLAFVQRAVTGM